MVKAIVFSNNSPVLLDLFFRSVKENNIDLFDFFVLYNSTPGNKESYEKIFNTQGVIGKEVSSFKDDLIKAIEDSNLNLISFFKDTNLFFSKLPEFNIEQVMMDQDVFCFSFSLGQNIKHCYYNDVYNVLLNEVENGANTIKWNWVKHYLDFGRPLELGGGHVFHKKEIQKLFKKWNYSDIKGLEDSFDNLDYYPKEEMSSFKNSVLVDVVSEIENPTEAIKSFNFNELDRKIIKV